MRKNFELIYLGEIFFKFGIVFLISAPVIGTTLILISSIIALILRREFLLKDKLNIPIFICLGILLFSTFKNIIFFHGISSKINIFLDLFNWVPFFLLFFSLPIYLEKEIQKEIFSRLIIISSFPVLISSFLQNYFNIYGPFNFFNGLIIWYQREPGIISSNSITGLFNNPNYTGFILCTLIPFIIYEIIKNKTKPFKFLVSIIILFLYLFNIVLTQSRNAMMGAIISLIFSLSIKLILLTITILICIFLIIYFLGNILIFESIPIFYNQIFNKLAFLNFVTFSETIRYQIWDKSLQIISNKPLLGWGGSTFAILYALNKGNFTIQHAHNLPLQIAQNNGLPLSIIITFFIFYLINKSLRITNKDKILVNRFWTLSLFVGTFHQLFDVVLYDGRLNIFYCILICGSKCIVNSEQKYKNFELNEDI